jgi:hypothetical protein
MADTPNPENTPGAQLAASAETAARIRELNERLIEFAMAAGSRRLDDYERALTSLLTFTEMTGATQLEWVAALAQTHANYIRDASRTYTTTLRTLLD